MLKILIKKQLFETFRSYFYDQKKNKSRSTAGIVAFFLLYAFLCIGILGGMFTLLSITLCPALVSYDMGWLFFLIMMALSILMGAFGSVFNTFSSLYLSKDNDLLLSMPIQVKDIIISRLLNVYILGSLYSMLVLFPAILVYWIFHGITLQIVLCDILLMVIVTLIVLFLSCLLGFCVAKISQKIKKKSIVSVFAVLIFFGLYYIFYFYAGAFVTELLENAETYGESLKGSAYFLYLLGQVGEGNILSTLLFLGITLVLVGLTWLALKKTFLSIATSSEKNQSSSEKKTKYKAKSISSSLLSKEFFKFFSSSNYMLNCGLGILFILAIGVVVLIKGSTIFAVLQGLFEDLFDYTPIAICGIFLMLATTIDSAAPSLSLEGKSLWILQSLPIEPKRVYKAKALQQFTLATIPTIFSMACIFCVYKTSILTKLLILVLVESFYLFSACWNTFLGTKMVNLVWTNEVFPIKQGGAVSIAIFGGWLIVALFVVPSIFIAPYINTNLYLLIFTIIFLIPTTILIHWFCGKGKKLLENL